MNPSPHAFVNYVYPHPAPLAVGVVPPAFIAAAVIAPSLFNSPARRTRSRTRQRTLARSRMMELQEKLALAEQTHDAALQALLAATSALATEKAKQH